MGENKNLLDTEAIAMIKRIAKGQTAMLGTMLADGTPRSRPMSTLAVDDDGTLWFFSKKDSEENQELKANPATHLVYAVESKLEYLSLVGTAQVLRDQAKIDELWTPIAKTWFTAGKEDPLITLVKVTPRTGHYWDTKTSKMVAFAKILVGAVIGKTMDDGVHGQMKL